MKNCGLLVIVIVVIGGGGGGGSHGSARNLGRSSQSSRVFHNQEAAC